MTTEALAPLKRMLTRESGVSIRRKPAHLADNSWRYAALTLNELLKSKSLPSGKSLHEAK
jgi:hypothetical protein